MRTLVDIPEEDIRSLDEIAARGNRSRAAAIREAVKLFLVRNSNKEWIETGYGYWADRVDIRDGVEYQQAIREDRTPYEEL
ncbi:ribbon-helix-helix domain-containing protein [Sphingomonas bacterium]|uniref:ribbon-helix-helix domain-containing protein n=1 Tax=Sphingomonas bacterium TaxID=1895847 RepID=UPI001575CE36|nr:ribbon-helix-helix domain-containing protein [Sphingomonas bacterium]